MEPPATVRAGQPRVLVVSATTGYQLRAFDEAAARLGVELVFATDRCHALPDPWRDGAIPVRFHEPDLSLSAVLDGLGHRTVAGLLAVGDRPTALAARVAEALGLPWHPPRAARASANKVLLRRRLRQAGLPTPTFTLARLGHAGSAATRWRRFPCVVKPLALSGSRGVIRADDPGALASAIARVVQLLRQPDVRALRDVANEALLIEDYVAGRELAVEGVLHRGTLRVLAIFDKPDPLEGPFFEESIYVTPAELSARSHAGVVAAVEAASAALGLYHGPIHAECRLADSGTVILEVAARPIGGLCARALRFVDERSVPCGLEDLLLRHALGEPLDRYRRESDASGVLMVPIGQAGHLREVGGVDAARAIPGVYEVEVTAKPGQQMVPLPEGAGYPGFVFARAASAAEVTRALRRARACLRFVVDTALPVVSPR